MIKHILKLTSFLIIISLFLFCNSTVSNEPDEKEVAQLVSEYNDIGIEEEKITIDTSISIDYLMGKFDPLKHPDFVKVDIRYASQSDFYLRKASYEAFGKMNEAAKKEGITLKIISATRPFIHQKRIWEAKWSGSRKVEGKNLSETVKNPVDRALKILEFSSMPGTSRHHWGTDIDINALTNDYFEKGQGLAEYNWLVANAGSFGFCQPYSPKDTKRMNGYNEEKWHWSYLPIAKKLTDQYKLRLNDKMINGFKGAETASVIGVKEKYVLGINEDCL